MAVIGIPTITAPGIPADASRPLPTRDPLLSGVANSGVRFLADLAFPWCYPGGDPATRPAAGAPSNGALVRDVAELANGSVALPAGSIGFAGGGLDMTNVQINSNTPAGIVIPASVAADIATAYGGKVQRFLVATYVKLPLLADWTSGTFSFLGDKTFNAGPSLIAINEAAAGALNLRRQNGAGTADNISITPAAADYGSVAQVAAYRTDTGIGFRLRSAAGTVLQTAAVGADNNQAFGTNVINLGYSTAFPGGLGGAVMTVGALKGLRVYRAFIENLARSGRDPVAVLDADWARQQARGLFS